MINVTIPGVGEFLFKYIVLDYNGTIALDGHLLDQVQEKLNQIAENLKVYIVTADTFGIAAVDCEKINGELVILKSPIGADEKEKFIESLGAEYVVAVGNGNNDRKMLLRAGLGIGVIGHEGASMKTLQAADIVVHSVIEGLELLLNPKRLVATLRG